MADLNRMDPQWAWSVYRPDGKRPWNRTAAAHLLRRAGFGAGSRQLAAATKSTPRQLVKAMLGADDPAVTAFDRQMQQFSRQVLASGDAQDLSAWWLYRMIGSPRPLLEKITLFWHGHFATSAAKVQDPALMLAQHNLFRQHGLGSFRTMMEHISRDPAMLVYLDSTTNRKTHPNENYAREVMELFCLGLGNYTESDIQQVARAFTGWEVRRGTFRFNPHQHDRRRKKILGQSGTFDGNDAVRIIVEQPAASRFIAEKLMRFFMFDESQIPTQLVEPLAQELRDHDFQIAPAIERLLTCRLFFSEHAIGRKVRSPVEMGVGLLRSLEGTANTVRLAEDLAELGHALFFPPNVKGWDGGRTWINSATLLGRANLVIRLTAEGQSRFGGDGLAKLAHRSGARSPAATVDWLADLLLPVSVPASVRSRLISLASAGGDNGNHRVARVVQAIGALPEFQLS